MFKQGGTQKQILKSSQAYGACSLFKTQFCSLGMILPPFGFSHLKHSFFSISSGLCLQLHNFFRGSRLQRFFLFLISMQLGFLFFFFSKLCHFISLHQAVEQNRNLSFIKIKKCISFPKGTKKDVSSQICMTLSSLHL